MQRNLEVTRRSAEQETLFSTTLRQCSLYLDIVQQEEDSLAVMMSLQFTNLLALELQPVDLPDVVLPGLLAPVGVVTVRAREGDAHVLCLDVAGHFALCVLLAAGPAHPAPAPGGGLHEEAARN